MRVIQESPETPHRTEFKPRSTSILPRLSRILTTPPLVHFHASHAGKYGFLHVSGLYPTGDLEAAKCDAAMDLATDYNAHGLPYYHEKDEARKVPKSSSAHAVVVLEREYLSCKIFLQCVGTILVC